MRRDLSLNNFPSDLAQPCRALNCKPSSSGTPIFLWLKVSFQYLRGQSYHAAQKRFTNLCLNSRTRDSTSTTQLRKDQEGQEPEIDAAPKSESRGWMGKGLREILPGYFQYLGVLRTLTQKFLLMSYLIQRSNN